MMLQARLGAPKKTPGMRKTLFEFFDVGSSPKAILPMKIFLAKAKSLFHDYYE